MGTVPSNQIELTIADSGRMPWMEHGATAVNDVTLLFITNKPFAICYEQDDNHPYPMET